MNKKQLDARVGRDPGDKAIEKTKDKATQKCEQRVKTTEYHDRQSNETSARRDLLGDGTKPIDTEISTSKACQHPSDDRGTKAQCIDGKTRDIGRAGVISYRPNPDAELGPPQQPPDRKCQHNGGRHQRAEITHPKRNQRYLYLTRYAMKTRCSQNGQHQRYKTQRKKINTDSDNKLTASQRGTDAAKEQSHEGACGDSAQKAYGRAAACLGPQSPRQCAP